MIQKTDITTGTGTGKNEKKMSSVAFGTHKFGLPEVLDRTAFELLDTYVSYGGNVIDTARCYAGGKSDALLGEWLKISGARDSLVLCTKCGEPEYIGDLAKSRINEKELTYDFEKSFDALGTEYIDIYFVHKDDPAVPAGEVIEILNKFVKNGCVREIGASNRTNERIAEANDYAKAHGLVGFKFSEMSFSLKHRVTEGWGERAHVLEMDKKEFESYKKSRIPLFGYSSQAYGFFDKYFGTPIDEVNASERNKKNSSQAA